MYIIVSGEFGFIEQPTSQNASEGSSVVFNCTAYSKGYYWTVDGQFIDHEDNQNRGLSKQDEIINDITDLKIHLLTVPATTMNDGITVECYIYSSETIGSESGVLQVQGDSDFVFAGYSVSSPQ